MNNALTKTLIAGLMHGLKVEFENRIGVMASMYFVAGTIKDKVWCISLEEDDEESELSCSVRLDKVKPFLFPMSALTKEIKWNGEKFVPLYAILVIGEELKYLRIDEDAKMLSYFLSHPLGWDDIEKIDKAPHWVFELLIMWHFNVFNLSPDEFIEVNETNNPYK